MMMRSFSVRVALTLGVLSFLILDVLGTTHLSEEELKECQKLSRKTLKQLFKETGQCNREWKGKTKSQEEHSKKMGCVVRCVIERRKLLDENGLVTTETINRALEGKVEGKVKVIMEKLMHFCNGLFGKTLDPKDEFCGGYSKLGSCIQNGIADGCQVDMPF